MEIHNDFTNMEWLSTGHLIVCRVHQRVTRQGKKGMNGLGISLVPNMNPSIKTGGSHTFVQRIKGNRKGPVLMTGKLVLLPAFLKGVFVGNLVIGANEK